MHRQATPCIAPGNCWRAYTNQKPWGSYFAYLQWMVSIWKHLEHILGLPGTAGSVGHGRQKHQGPCVDVFLDVPPQQAAAGKSILSPSLLMNTATSMCVRSMPGLSMPTALRGSIVVGAEQVAAHLPPEGRCFRENLFQLELNHSPCVTVHVKWDNQANTRPVGFFNLLVSRFASPIPSYFYKCSCFKILSVVWGLLGFFFPSWKWYGMN